MDKIILNREEEQLAEKIAAYYRHPERTSYFDKESFFEAIHKNPDIHYQAVIINQNIYQKFPKRI